MGMPKQPARSRTGHSAGDKTRERIILAAEELVAAVGPGGASAREIARIAGLKNNVSVQYHFGSIEQLFEEVIQYRMGSFETIRQKMLDSIDAPDTATSSIDALWTIICLPQISVRGGDGRFQYAMFLCNYLPVCRPEGFSLVNRTSPERLPALGKVLTQLRARLPDIPLDVFDRRITSANLLFLNTCRGIMPDGSESDRILERNPLVRDAFRQSVAALTAPWAP